MRIDADTSRRELALLSGTDRYSEQRRSELQRLANVLTDPDLRVQVSFQESTAFARPASDDEPHDFEIHIPVKRFQQVETELPDHRWDRRVQLALLFHELGHVFYSDFERFRERQRAVRPIYREVFKTFYNAAEDVVIEAQLAAEYALQHDFVTLNDTFRKLQRQDQRRYLDRFPERHGETYTYTIFEALEIGILAQGFGSVNRFTDIVDETVTTHRVHGGRDDVVAELVSDLEMFVEDMLTLPDGNERVDRAFEFFQRVRPMFTDLPTIQTVRVQTESFRPVEAGNEPIRPSKPATELPVETSSPGQSETTTRGDDHSTRPATETDPRRVDTDDVETLLGGVESDDNSPLRREAARLLDIVQSPDTQVGVAGVVEPDEGDGDPHRWEQARRQAQQLTADLRSSLRRRRRSTLQSGHRFGQIDPHRIVAAVQGRDRVFQRREPGDDRDYSCLIVLDRSGSMSGPPIAAAESATAQLVHALTTVGVDTSVLSLWRSRPWLELPFGGEPRRFADHLTSARANGGTPLFSALAVARERVVTGTGTRPFVVVVTDGSPGYPDTYIEELERCTFDVYGVYIGDADGTHAQYFDRLVYTDPDSVDTTLRALARELFD